MTLSRIVFHLPAKHLADWRGRRPFALFNRIAEVLEPRGAKIEVRDRRLGPFQGGLTDFYADGDLHILDTGRARGPGVLNASIAYLPPFWHLDPQGMQAESSIGGRIYDPTKVNQKHASAFFERMRGRYTLARQSRRGQEMEARDLPQGGFAVFLQGDQPQLNGLTYCSSDQMLETVAKGAGGRPILVKPHPLALEHDSEVIARAIEAGLPITPCMANVNDMIAASVVTVSFNSACALEGFLQRKPAILFGASDFHHFAHSVRDPSDFPKALANALALKPEGYAKFLSWYFQHNCLNVTSTDFPAKLLQIMESAGFSAQHLGLHDAP